jgi:LSD1 subclass zinc finger protein
MKEDELLMIEVRCKKCDKLLMKIKGTAYVEIKCPRCKAINKYNIKPPEQRK